MTTDVVDIRIINSEMGIKCMAKYDYILKRIKRETNKYNGHKEHQAFRNSYEISEV